MLADSSLSNLRLITKELMSMHHQSDPSLCKEFDVSLRRSSPSMICAALMGKTKRVKLCVSVCVCVPQYLPPVESRSVSGFVGLKNGGATCYMNAVFQQLYMQPGLPEVRAASF